MTHPRLAAATVRRRGELATARPLRDRRVDDHRVPPRLAAPRRTRDRPRARRPLAALAVPRRRGYTPVRVPPAWTIALVVLTRTPPVSAADPAVPTQAPRSPLHGPPGHNLPGPSDLDLPAELSTPPAPDAPRIGVAILRADDLDHAALARAIQLRSPRLVLVTAGDEPPQAVDGELRAYIEVRRREPALVELTLILADGRAWLRRVDVDPDAPARPIAGALANLIAGIEDESVAPDRKDAPVPQALVETPPPEPEPAKPPPQEPAPPIIKPAAEPPAPRWQLGPLLRLGATLGLAPPDPGPHGLGFGGGLDARAPRGLLLALDLQFLARPVGDYLLTRTRVALGVGYALRRGNFELPLALLLGVEPWRLRDDRGAASLASDDGPPRPLLGAGLRVSPGYSAPVGKSARLRVGLRLDLWTSGQPARGGLGRPELRLPDGPTIGLGGPELHLGLEVGLWFGVGKPRARRP